MQHPPYWDGVMGVFYQGSWLSRNAFDFSLLSQQDDFSGGGPRIYRFNSVALLYGIALRFFSPQLINLALHLGTLALASWTLTLLISLLRERYSTRDSILWALVVASCPIFSSQTATIYLEIPLAFAFILVISLLSKNRVLPAALISVAACTIKPTAIILCAGVLTWGIFSRLIGHSFAKERSWRTLILLISPFILACGSSIVELQANLSTSESGPVRWSLSNAIGIIRQSMIVEPIVILLALLGCAWILGSGKRRAAAFAAAEKSALMSLAAIMSLGMWAAMFLFPIPLCRYIVTVTAPAVLFLALATREFASPRLCRALALVLLLMNGVNQHGALLPALHPAVARSGEQIERSREFLQDIEDCVELCRVIEKDYPDAVILARRPFVQMLVYPEFGYVKKALKNVISVGGEKKIDGARVLRGEGLSEHLRSGALVIYSPTCFEVLAGNELLPRGEFKVLFFRSLRSGAPLILYQIPARE